MESIKSKIALLLEVNNVEDADELESFEWFDSLTILSLIALADETYNVVLSADDVKQSKTIGGLLELIKSRIDNK